MNAFVMVCVMLGFLSLFSVYLPSQVSQARGKNDAVAVTGMISPLGSPTLNKKQKKTHNSLPAWMTVPSSLQPDVAFWRSIYATYPSTHSVFHDNQYLDIVYHVENLSVAKDNKELREDLESKIKQTIAKHLDELAALPNPKSLSAGEQKIWQRFHTLPNGFEEAKKRIRCQWGLSEKFAAGLQYSGRYMGEIEKVFAEHGVPKELTRLVFVESLFNPKANSSVGARGVWQFMRDAGKHYQLTINEVIDERADPLKSAHAAAKLLKDNYNYLGNWPMAINAYNAGRGRLKQASVDLGTNDIARIIREFKHPAYGFASRNFYLEFLAAVDVVENAEHYFGTLSSDEPLQFDTITIAAPLSLPAALKKSHISLDLLSELNPSLSRKVLDGKVLLPTGTALRLPKGSVEKFSQSIALQKDNKKRRA